MVILIEILYYSYFLFLNIPTRSLRAQFSSRVFFVQRLFFRIYNGPASRVSRGFCKRSPLFISFVTVPSMLIPSRLFALIPLNYLDFVNVLSFFTDVHPSSLSSFKSYSVSKSFPFFVTSFPFLSLSRFTFQFHSLHSSLFHTYSICP